MEETKDVSILITETQQKLVDVLNGSHLHPSVLMLIMQNLTSQLQTASAQIRAEKAD